MNEHVRYEWQMLEACYHALKKLRNGMMIPAMITGGDKANGQFLFNVLHEAFCVHARNLINWNDFENDNTYVIRSDIANLLDKIEDQIVTLVPENRTAKVEEKLNDKDRDILFKHVKEFMDEAQRSSQTDQI